MLKEGYRCTDGLWALCNKTWVEVQKNTYELRHSNAFDPPPDEVQKNIDELRHYVVHDPPPDDVEDEVSSSEASDSE